MSITDADRIATNLRPRSLRPPAHDRQGRTASPVEACAEQVFCGRSPHPPPARAPAQTTGAGASWAGQYAATPWTPVLLNSSQKLVPSLTSVAASPQVLA